MPQTHDILIIEDNPADVELTLEAFRRGKIRHRLQVCRDGEDALDYLFARGRYERDSSLVVPDLVLLDLNLPKRSGWEVLEEMRASEKLKAVPVVVLTTSARQEDVTRSYQCGANAFLTKPVQFQECIELVESIQHFWLELVRLPAKFQVAV